MRYTILLLIMMVNLNGLPEPVEPPREVITVEATAYCACKYCCGKTDGITASGVKATAGRTIAADHSLPFGTVVIIDGHEYVVEDRGGGVKGERVDIYFNTHQEALNFGRRTVEMEVTE